ncbi:MAG: aspartate carbamoyltransferase catalytic subunit [Pseudomonadota bacterium]
MSAPSEAVATTPTNDVQRWPDGSLRHLLTLDGLPGAEITALLDLADSFQAPTAAKPVRNTSLDGYTIANLFFEPSTRTRASFEIAAKRLAADVINLDVNTSSRIKGESILDTIYTLEAMRCDYFVVRDASVGVPQMIAEHVQPHVAVLNAGEASVAHPTQGLLDVLTIRRHKGRFDQLVVAIVGDVGHSRVARSAYHALTALGVGECRLVAPGALAPDAAAYPAARIMESVDDALRGADVVMTLRIQRERLESPDGAPDGDDYHVRFGITAARLTLAKPDAILMHPGPMNRSVEIASDIADGPQSVITEQVANGVAVRMAVLSEIHRNRLRQLAK